MLIPYFSGIASATELNLVQLSGAKHILIDRIDFKKLRDKGIAWTQKTALDSGAYKLHHNNVVIDQEMTRHYLIEKYFELAMAQGVSYFDFVVTMDFFGQPELTQECWDYMRRRGMHESLPLMPVWVWGSDRASLHTYLDQASLVGIGGLVPPMRARDETVLAELTALCTEFPGRFHLFGLSWLKAINAVKETGFSFDSSTWLRSAKRFEVFFTDTRTGKLSKAPAVAVGDGELTSGQLAVKSIKAIQEFLYVPSEASTSESVTTQSA